MKYIFVVNGRFDKAHILPDLEAQLSGREVSYSIYVTTGIGDATRYVRMYSEFHSGEEVCFVACGGSGTMNEVASALVGAGPEKRFAFLAYGTTNDFTKIWPGRNFTSLEALLDGEERQVDIIRCNDDYSLNVSNIGFDAMVAYRANEFIELGWSNPYGRSVLASMLGSRFNYFHVWADGEKISRCLTMLCTVSNGGWCGGEFHCAPRAVVDDGLMEVCLIRSMPLLLFLTILPLYRSGRHLDSKRCMRHMAYRRAKRVIVESPKMMYVSLDGEITAATRFEFEILEKAVRMRLPRLEEEAAQ